MKETIMKLALVALTGSLLSINGCRSDDALNRRDSTPIVNSNVAPTPISEPAKSSPVRVIKLEELNPYHGAINDLLTKQIGDAQEAWVRIDEPETDFAFKSLGAKDATKARYGRLPIDGGEHKFAALLVVGNFQSAEAANAALKKESDARKISLSQKKKAGKVVGKEFITAKGLLRIWTDGSLLITLSSLRATKSPDMERFSAILPY